MISRIMEISVNVMIDLSYKLYNLYKTITTFITIIAQQPPIIGDVEENDNQSKFI
jgi:hypothetical protein